MEENGLWDETQGEAMIKLHRKQANNRCRQSRFLGKLASWLSLLILLLWANGAAAAACSSNATGNWGTVSTWNCGHVPANGDTVTILNGHTVTMNVTTNVLGSLTVNAGGTLALAGTSAFDLYLGGNLTNNGTINFQSSSGTNTIYLAGANITSTFSGTGSWLLDNLDLNGNAPSCTGACKVELSGSPNLQFGNTDLFAGNSATYTFNALGNSTATVTMNRAGNQTVAAVGVIYPNLVLAGTNTKTMGTANAQTINILGNLTVNNGVTLSETNRNPTMTVVGSVSNSGTYLAGTGAHTFGNFTNGGTYTSGSGAVSIAGNFTNSGTFTPSTSTFTFNGSAAQTISGATTFNNITIANGSATVSVNNNLTVGGILTLNTGATLGPAPGVVISGAGTLTGDGTAQVTRTAATADFNSQYTIANKTLTSMTVEYAGTGAQTVSARSYWGLKISNASGAALATGTTTVNGTLTLTSGTLAVGANTLILDGPTIAGTPANLSTTASSNLSFTGSATGVNLPSSVVSLNDLTVNNVNGLALNSSPIVGGTLRLTNGSVVTGANVLSTSANCDSSISRTNGFVEGNLRLTFPSGTTPLCTFAVGSGTTYAPIGVNMVTTVAGGGTLTGSTVGNEHAQITTSPIDPTKDANRYWTLWASGDTVNVSTYGATFNFETSDLDINAATSNFKVGKYVNSAWTLPTPVTVNPTSTGISNVAGPIDRLHGFAVGEATPAPCTPPAGSPSNMTCVCDNFGRATLNPSTIYGGNWQLTSSGGTYFLPSIINSGYLQMTQSQVNESTAATMPGTFPAKGNLIIIDFKHYAYNGNGADGMALTLSNASVPPAPGAFGGSLGYAQKTGINGFNGGWVGIGIDEFGNYSANTEGRTGGPALGFLPDAVAVRGSGSGVTGYPYLAGTSSSLSPEIDSANSTTPAAGHAYRISVDARCYEANAPAALNCDNAALAKKTQVTVYRDTSGLGNFNSGNKLVDIDAYAANASQADVPTNWRLSFTGSTGSNTNIHEIQGLKICAQTITPPAGYGIAVDQVSPSTCSTPTTSPSSPIVTITALDSNGNTVTTYNKTVTLSATLPNGSASSATWRKVGAGSNLAGNQYTFVAADQGVARFYLTDASQQDVVISVSENGGTISSTSASAVPFRGGSFSVVNIDSLATNAGGGVVAGRPHLMSITRGACGGVTDATYSGAKSLDGWYTPDISHPSGANPPQICAPNASGLCYPGPIGACSTLSIAPPTVSAGSNNLPTLNFSGGVANFCLMTTDVGKYSLSVRDDSITTATISATTAAPLTVKPFTLAVSNIKQDTTLNAGGAAANGSKFIAAGDPFQATIGAYLWNAAADSNNDGSPDGGASFSQITGSGAAPSYSWATTLSVSTFAPAGGTKGSMGNGPIGTQSGTCPLNAPNCFTGGVAIPTNLSYSEVGSFTMTGVATDFLSTTGVSMTPLIFDNSSPPVRNSVVGRFFPHHFAIDGTAGTVGTVGYGCSSGQFTYEGQSFNLSFTLQAQNRSNGLTKNYGVTGYAPLATGSLSLVAENANDGNNLNSPPRILPALPAIADWGDGTAAKPYGQTSISATPSFTRPTTPDGPYNALALGLILSDNSGDNVPLQGTDMNAVTSGICSPCTAVTLGGPVGGPVRTTRMLYGRMRIDNGYGSELLPLPVNLEAQYWNGATAGYTRNVSDSCTSLASANFSYAQGQGAIVTTTIVGGGTLSSGVGKIRLNTPTMSPANRKGSVVLSTGAPLSSYLPGAGTETFGVYKGGPVIYIREMY